MTFEEWWEQVEAYGLGLPEGYVLVPVEPAEKMKECGWNVHMEIKYDKKGYYLYTEPTHVRIYKAMIKAAQEEQ